MAPAGVTVSPVTWDGADGLAPVVPDTSVDKLPILLALSTAAT